jgi:hypothetical protein
MATRTRCPICGGSKASVVARWCYGCRYIIRELQNKTRPQLEDKLWSAKVKLAQIQEALR